MQDDAGGVDHLAVVRADGREGSLPSVGEDRLAQSPPRRHSSSSQFEQMLLLLDRRPRERNRRGCAGGCPTVQPCRLRLLQQDFDGGDLAQEILLRRRHNHLLRVAGRRLLSRAPTLSDRSAASRGDCRIATSLSFFITVLRTTLYSTLPFCADQRGGHSDGNAAGPRRGLAVARGVGRFGQKSLSGAMTVAQ